MNYLFVLLLAISPWVFGQNVPAFNGETHDAGEIPFYDAAHKISAKKLTETPAPLKSLPKNLAEPEGNWFVIKLPAGLESSEQEWFLQIDFPNIDRVDFYLPVKAGWQHYETGDEVSFSSWPVKHRIPSIPLSGMSGNTLYAKVSMASLVVFPLLIVDKNELESQVVFSNSYYSALFAVIVALVIYNFSLYLFLRDSSYIFYVAYILSFTLVQLSVCGIGQQYLWPEWNHATTRIALVAIAATNFFLPYFVIHFVSLASSHKKLFHVLQTGAWIPLAVIPFVFLQNYAYSQYILHFVSVVNMLVIFAIAMILTGQKNRPAAYLFISYTILFFAIFLSLFQQNGWIETNFWVKHLMEMAILFEALLLSIGLADRFNALRMENLRIANEKRRDQERFYGELVRVRDKEKYDLGKTLHDSISHDLLVIKNRLSNAPDLRDLVNPVMDKVRNISHMMHPYHIEQLGFELAAEAVAEQSFEGTETECLIDVNCGEVPEKEAVLMYSLLQECLNNVVKHACASECFLQIHKLKDSDGDRLSLSLKDDGVGFDISVEHQGLGLRMARYSIESNGGTMEIRSEPGNGTRIQVDLLLNLK